MVEQIIAMNSLCIYKKLWWNIKIRWSEMKWNRWISANIGFTFSYIKTYKRVRKSHLQYSPTHFSASSSSMNHSFSGTRAEVSDFITIAKQWGLLIMLSLSALLLNGFTSLFCCQTNYEAYLLCSPYQHYCCKKGFRSSFCCLLINWSNNEACLVCFPYQLFYKVCVCE